MMHPEYRIEMRRKSEIRLFRKKETVLAEETTFSPASRTTRTLHRDIMAK
jgi:hypothetical protein